MSPEDKSWVVVSYVTPSPESIISLAGGYFKSKKCAVPGNNVGIVLELFNKAISFSPVNSRWSTLKAFILTPLIPPEKSNSFACIFGLSPCFVPF